MKNINVFGYATFGTPNGFTQSCVYGNKGLEKVLKTFDLKTNAIQLISPSDRIYSIRKESIQNISIVSYSVYTYAKEKKSDRNGTFIGTSLVLTNEILPENLVLKSLHEIHQKLKNNNVSNNILNVIHSKDFNTQDIFSRDFEKLEHQTNTFDSLEWENSGKNLVIYIAKFEQNEIQNLFKKSLLILSKYDTVYFIDSKEIAEFVSQKKLFRLIEKSGLDEEIIKLESERKQRILDTISNFKTQRQKLEEEGIKEEESFKKYIDQNKEKHDENRKKIEGAEGNLIKLKKNYQDFLSKLTLLISELESGKKIEDVNNSFKIFEREFNEEKRKLGSLASISLLSDTRTQNILSPYLNPYAESFSYDKSKRNEKRSNVAILIIVSAILNVLLIGGIIYLYFFNDKNAEKIEATVNSPVAEDHEAEKDSIITLSKLNPFPNDYAKDELAKKLVMENIKDSTFKIGEVSSVIFNKNSKIKNVYQYQKTDYINYLLLKNPEAFKIDTIKNDTLLINKSLLNYIPSYSKK